MYTGSVQAQGVQLYMNHGICKYAMCITLNVAIDLSRTKSVAIDKRLKFYNSNPISMETFCSMPMYTMLKYSLDIIDFR